MENFNLTEEKIGRYPSKKDLQNYVVDKELTVTITLDEYRELVSKNAVAANEIDKKQSKIWELESKVRELEAKIVELTVGKEDD